MARNSDTRSRFVLLNRVTSDTTSDAIAVPKGRKTYDCALYGTSGAVSATVIFYGHSKDDFDSAIPLTDPILLSGTGAGATTSADSGGIELPGEWTFIWADSYDLTGTGAAVDASVSV